MLKAQNLLRLNFKSFDDAWILNYSYTLLREGWSLTEWKKEILYFLIDWLSHSEDIKTTTSGSTGTPKTISLKREYVKNSAEATNNFFGLKKGDNALLCLPVKYIAGKLMIVRALETKMNLYCIEPSLTPDFKQLNIDFAAMTPAQVSSLLETHKGKKLLNNIEKLIIGGDKISVSLEDKLQELDTQIWHTYGMTETITHIALRKVNGINKTKYFTSLKGINISLSDDNCLIIDAPKIGVRFLKTNDIAKINEDGSFKIIGRKDNVVISGGIKLFPEEIEKKTENLIKYPYFFTGVTDNKLGSKLVMVIESKQPVNKTAIYEEIKPILSKFEIPKNIIVVDNFERTSTGKIKRIIPKQYHT
jgi:O-succinylbenzoic acid--CoA ligase